MQDGVLRQIADGQFNAMHAYNWKISTRFENTRFAVKEVNKAGALRKGRVPRLYPMLRALPIAMPYLRHDVAAVSMKDLSGGEMCVPMAVYTWLMERSSGKKTSLFLPPAAIERFPHLATPPRKPCEPAPKKTRVTYDSVKALLDAIHEEIFRASGGAEAGLHPDPGHNTEDVEELVRLFGCKMYARDMQGTIIGEVVDGDAHHPLCYTVANGHMYWHSDRKVADSWGKSAMQQRTLGHKQGIYNGSSNSAEPT